MNGKRREIAEVRQGFAALSFNDCLRHLREFEAATDLSALEPLKVAVLRSYTVEMLEPALRLRLLCEGYNAELFFGDYNGYAQEILDPGSPLYAFSPDVVLVLVRTEELLPDLIDDFASRPPDEWMKDARASAATLASLADRISERLPCKTLFQNMSLTATPYLGLFDSQAPSGQRYVIDAMNMAIAEVLSTRMNSFVWDFDAFVKRSGHSSIFDPKGWYTARSPFRQSAYPLLADDIARYVLAMLKRVKKCVVLDLDNTLWGGIAGEDGFDGIRLGHDYPGNCFMDFQKRLLRLYNRGIILAINSKNNESDALEIIRRHPYMVLREEHFAAMQINWGDKVSNMRCLARDLNIGLESMVFIDDNPAECELVREGCPEVDVVLVPERPYLIPSLVDRLPLVENITITDEDRSKGEMYRAQMERKACETRFENIDDFLSHLDMEVRIRPADEFTIPRVAQLTQKTNQMNLTTRRYREADIQRFLSDGTTRVFSVSAKDRFGDNGIVGVMILKADGADRLIDTFLLSCRVIGRNIEQAMLAFLAETASAEGARRLVGEYKPTAKNKPASGMYERFGFRPSTDGLYALSLQGGGIDYPSYINVSAGANSLQPSSNRR